MGDAIKVYCYCKGSWGWGNEVWEAVSEFGQVITGHISSSRYWGIHDTSPDVKHVDYADCLGRDFYVEIIVLPDGAIPPQPVLDAQKLLEALAAS